MLKNDGILPLDNSTGSIAVIGPLANATNQMQGNYVSGQELSLTRDLLIGPFNSLIKVWTGSVFDQSSWCISRVQLSYQLRLWD